MPRDVGLQDRRVLAADKFPLLLAFLPGQHADVGAGEERLETRDIAGEEARLYHPEDRLLGQEGLGLASCGHGHDDMRMVGSKF